MGKMLLQQLLPWPLPLLLLLLLTHTAMQAPVRPYH